jgi:hypothetical protein
VEDTTPNLGILGSADYRNRAGERSKRYRAWSIEHKAEGREQRAERKQRIGKCFQKKIS